MSAGWLALFGIAAAAIFLGGCGADREKGKEQFKEAMDLVTTNSKQAMKLLEKSCGNENASACALLAGSYIGGHRGFDLKADRSKAVKFAQKLTDIYIKYACEEKDNKQACEKTKLQSAGLRERCADKESSDCATAIKLLSIGFGW
jgi:hypothetical protein